MRIPAINSQAFKGLLVIPKSYLCNVNEGKRVISPQIEIETDDIIEIDNTNYYNTEISYNDRGSSDLKKHTYYHNGSDFERSRILLAYAAAATQKDIIVKA